MGIDTDSTDMPLEEALKYVAAGEPWHTRDVAWEHQVVVQLRLAASELERLRSINSDLVEALQGLHEYVEGFDIFDANGIDRLIASRAALSKALGKDQEEG